MKKELATMYKFVVGFVGMVITLWSCSSDPGKIGLGLLPTGDLVKVSSIVEKDAIKAYTATDGNMRTDEPAYNLLGTFNDPIFGKTTADFAFQVRLNSYPDYSKIAVPDSLVLSLLYMEVYGDTLTPQKLKVYELGTDLVLDDKYYQDTNLKGFITGNAVGELNYIPKFKLDSLSTKYGSTKALPKDTVIQEIAIKLDNSLLQKLWAADSLTMSDNDRFIKFFKGLYIEAGDLNQAGSIMKINSIAVGSQLVMHYHNSDNDTLKLNYAYSINTNSARVSRFAHDYPKTVFDANLDSLIYLQSSGGLRAKILIPDLVNWSDSSNIAINQAQLIFQIDTTIAEVTKYPPAEQLVLAVIGKTKTNQDSLYLPSDHTFSSAYYGGIYNSKDKTYRFNIAKQMKDIIDKKKVNYGFYLATAFRSDTYRQTVLKGATSKTGIKFQITYSKIKK